MELNISSHELVRLVEERLEHLHEPVQVLEILVGRARGTHRSGRHLQGPPILESGEDAGMRRAAQRAENARQAPGICNDVPAPVATADVYNPSTPQRLHRLSYDSPADPETLGQLGLMWKELPLLVKPAADRVGDHRDDVIRHTPLLNRPERVDARIAKRHFVVESHADSALPRAWTGSRPTRREGYRDRNTVVAENANRVTWGTLAAGARDQDRTRFESNARNPGLARVGDCFDPASAGIGLVVGRRCATPRAEQPRRKECMTTLSANADLVAHGTASKTTALEQAPYRYSTIP